METREAIYCRKSVRSFTGEISKDILEEILKAAKAAPIGMGKYDTMHLTVVEQPQLLQTIDAATARLFGHPELHPLYGAPVFIVVSVKPEGEMPNNTEYSNAAVMVQNMALAAVDAGIGCCHIWGGGGHGACGRQGACGTVRAAARLYTLLWDCAGENR